MPQQVRTLRRKAAIKISLTDIQAMGQSQSQSHGRQMGGRQGSAMSKKQSQC